ncbi:uncharacterized protein RHIMIDRAFT_248802 [Rhizopus microsporus ATCC 52813]|uniref:Uncharacterized protein n=1 Tax=Rhizopus microsporus ATCC 52813 TaxID=1340429 RepID=A0A2G4T3T0_RHIZD|nr:uncharacterized protein RHIMIDRAFT_248802 [Rhizopus microsporus ATCC 52813]PHZ15670.1 hypothetical protein RHIMIDRAFT_248802 [Rhizopus microsporus ATCC 52813]
MKIDNGLSKLGKITFSGTDNGLVTMTETADFDMKRFKFHLDLYNKHAALENLSEEGKVDTDIMDRAVTNINMLNHYVSGQETSEYTIQIPSYMVHAFEVDYKNGAQKYKKQRERAKNLTDIRRQVMETEALLSKVDTTSARNLEHLNELHNMYIEHKHIIRNFYYSPSRLKQKRAYELQKRKYTDRLCSNERRYATSSRKTELTIFAGDRGLVQAIYKNGTGRLRTINGAFICDNPSFVSVQAKKAVKGIDNLSAMEIGLSGLASLLFDAIFPQIDPQASQPNTDKFKTNAASFFTANEDRPAVDDSNIS